MPVVHFHVLFFLHKSQHQLLLWF